MPLLDLDARWRRFNDPDRACPCCGQTFAGIFDLGFEHPEDWPHPPAEGTEVAVGADRLNADLCRLGERRFLRGVLMLPVRGADDALAYGLWAEVAHEDFYRYLDAALDEGPAFAGARGHLANPVPGLETAPVACDLVPGDAGERPQLVASEGALVAAQTDGISFDTLLDLYEAAGHDLRPHLAAD
ncbi:DUF2199 domain-containing protein [Roseivivax isoporae]|uniref:DUF2199 domain-containing protein n=1 Tax=Roseivivax isoporae LMG 25204 TaxID=1449351 RepID=X7F8B1_9RHOB|nr:DUF2199 domain-containing protein [Roseivivax isoporae]ETX28324.1 hypothetical protein RISW2_08485 [Roseivivax isoporae LMG 25204]